MFFDHGKNYQNASAGVRVFLATILVVEMIWRGFKLSCQILWLAIESSGNVAISAIFAFTFALWTCEPVNFQILSGILSQF